MFLNRHGLRCPGGRFLSRLLEETDERLSADDPRGLQQD